MDPAHTLPVTPSNSSSGTFLGLCFGMPGMLRVRANSSASACLCFAATP